MKQFVISTMAAMLLGMSAIVAPALAQGAPMGPKDCKPGETWDAGTKTCKPNKPKR